MDHNRRSRKLRRTRSLSDQPPIDSPVFRWNEDDPQQPTTIPCEELFAEYRAECERCLLNFPDISKENQLVQENVDLLKKIIVDLLDQNECLVNNIKEIKIESENRISELRRSLEHSAARTEEVMLALESHELALKSFVQNHCCQCCACDMRLMEFKLCHGGTDLDQYCCSDPIDFGRCWFNQANRMTNIDVIHQTSHWLANGQLSSPSKCLHDPNSEMRFLHLVDLIDSKIRNLETENDQLKHENQMIRELNALLSYRQGPPLLLEDIREKIEQPRPTLDDHHQFDDTLSLSPMYESLNRRKNKFFYDENLSPPETNDKRDSFGSFESCSSETRQQDNDSGCSTDLIPSQTDIQSLLLSDFDDDSDSDLIVKSVVNSTINLMTNPTEASNENIDLETLRIRAAIADRVMPKLYNKLLYYMNQRNLLLCQFRQENRAREKCKKELSTLTDSLIKNLKFFDLRETNNKSLKEKNNNDTGTQSNIVCS